MIESSNRSKSGLARFKVLLKKRVAAQHLIAARRAVRMAKILIPVADGDAQGDIDFTVFADGSVNIFFGQKAKVIEGGRDPRPFVVPTMKVVRKKLRGQHKRALRQAIKEAFG